MKMKFEKWLRKFRYLMFALTAVIGAMTLDNYEPSTIEFLICMFVITLSFNNMVGTDHKIVWHEHKYTEED